MEGQDLVFVRDFAEQIGADRSRTLQNLKKYNVNIEKIRNPATGNALMSAITKEDADRFLKTRRQEGFGVITRNLVPTKNFIYIVHVDREVRPSRVKVGTTNDVQGRLQTYRTICPDAASVRVWEAPATCEGYALSVARTMGDQVACELFDIDDLDSFLAVMDGAFSPFSE